MAETVPLWPANATVSFVSVPFCTVPPVNETVPERLTVLPPRSSTPPAAERFAAPDPKPKALAAAKASVPALTVVVPP